MQALPELITSHSYLITGLNMDLKGGKVNNGPLSLSLFVVSLIKKEATIKQERQTIIKVWS